MIKFLNKQTFFALMIGCFFVCCSEKKPIENQQNKTIKSNIGNASDAIKSDRDKVIDPIILNNGRVKNDLREIKNNLEKIFIQENIYPDMAKTHSLRDASITKNNKITTFKEMGYPLPVDPYSVAGDNYHYFTFNQNNDYIISSNGPDLDDDLSNLITPEMKEISQSILDAIKLKIYDVSNGLQSDGDIILQGP